MSKEKQPIKEGLFSSAKKFTDAFFDGLKQNAINKALDACLSIRTSNVSMLLLKSHALNGESAGPVLLQNK